MNNTWLTDNVIIPLVLITIILLVFPLLVGYIVYVERKVLAFIQSRLGPMRVGPYGLLQPIADAVKLLTKEDIAPRTADAVVFKAAPIILLVVGLTALSFLPMGEGFSLFGYDVRLSIVEVNVGVLGLLAISSLSIYSLILGGWASNSKYPLLGALRSAAQMVSYEVALAFTVLATLMIAGTLSLNGIIEAQRQAGLWYVFVQPVGFVLFIIAMVAETNRLPFDLPEAESELVAGYFTEYSGFRWSFFMLGEYAAMTVMSGLLVTLYLGGWMRPFPNVELLSFLDFIPGFIWFVLKVGFFIYFFIWLRGTYPRYRYDQLMGLGWKVFIPVSIANLFVTGLLILIWDSVAA
jgi:NADH-quinone oxidoreductase subunit H